MVSMVNFSGTKPVFKRYLFAQLLTSLTGIGLQLVCIKRKEQVLGVKAVPPQGFY